jgi:ferric-dicitrate binding protein FerR (iron transport regulator)
VTEERFEELARCYGGDIARWPEGARDAAALFLAAAPETARAVLAREDALDTALDALPRATASAHLFERIVESAPALHRRRSWRGWLLPAGLGATLAATAAAGVLLGAQLGAQTTTLGNSEVASSGNTEFDVSGLAGDV